MAVGICTFPAAVLHTARLSPDSSTSDTVVGARLTLGPPDQHHECISVLLLPSPPELSSQ